MAFQLDRLEAVKRWLSRSTVVSNEIRKIQRTLYRKRIKQSELPKHFNFTSGVTMHLRSQWDWNNWPGEEKKKEPCDWRCPSIFSPTSLMQIGELSVYTSIYTARTLSSTANKQHWLRNECILLPFFSTQSVDNNYTTNYSILNWSGVSWLDAYWQAKLDFLLMSLSLLLRSLIVPTLLFFFANTICYHKLPAIFDLAFQVFQITKSQNEIR